MGRRTVRAVCAFCGKTFVVRYRSTRPAKFCSRSCVWKGTKGSEFNKQLSRKTAKVRGDRLRGRGSGDGYVKRECVHEHRKVAQKMLGRALHSDEVVHHIDGDKQNNVPENLEILTRAEHMRKHGIGIPGMKLWWRPWEKRVYR